MSITVTAPDSSEHEFPDGTNPAVIRIAMSKYMASQAPPPESLGERVGDVAGPLAGAGALAAGGLAATRIAQKIPGGVTAAMRLFPPTRGLAHGVDIAQAAGRLTGGGAPAEATAAAPAPVAPAVPLTPTIPAAEPSAPAAKPLPKGHIAVSQSDIDNHPALRGYKAGDPIRPATLERIKGAAPEPGSAASRISPTTIKAAGPGPSGQAEPYKPGPGAGRGASGPELERRAAALAKVKGSAEGRIAPRAAVAAGAEGEGGDLGPMMEASLGRTFTSAEKQAVQSAVTAGVEPTAIKAAIGSLGGPALQTIMMLMGQQPIGEQMQGAHDLYMQQHFNPSTRRALEGAPQGS